MESDCDIILVLRDHHNMKKIWMSLCATSFSVYAQRFLGKYDFNFGYSATSALAGSDFDFGKECICKEAGNGRLPFLS